MKGKKRWERMTTGPTYLKVLLSASLISTSTNDCLIGQKTFWQTRAAADTAAAQALDAQHGQRVQDKVFFLSFSEGEKRKVRPPGEGESRAIHRDRPLTLPESCLRDTSSSSQRWNRTSHGRSERWLGGGGTRGWSRPVHSPASTSLSTSPSARSLWCSSSSSMV